MEKPPRRHESTAARSKCAEGDNFFAEYRYGRTGSDTEKKSTESARNMCMTGCISSAKALTGRTIHTQEGRTFWATPQALAKRCITARMFMGTLRSLSTFSGRAWSAMTTTHTARRMRITILSAVCSEKRACIIHSAIRENTPTPKQASSI